MTKHQKATMGLGLDELVMLLNTGLPNMTGAVCAESWVDPDMFFDETAAGVANAKALCARCPVSDVCLSYAMSVKEQGIWGGYTEKERKQLRRNLNSATQMVDAVAVENRRLLCSSQSAAALARHFNVSERTIQRWRKELCATGANQTDAPITLSLNLGEVA